MYKVTGPQERMEKHNQIHLCNLSEEPKQVWGSEQTNLDIKNIQYMVDSYQVH